MAAVHLPCSDIVAASLNLDTPLNLAASRTGSSKSMNRNSLTAEETEDEFFVQCGLPDCPEARRVAAAVRSTIAQLGGIPSPLIHASFSFESLDYLPFFRNCGDVGFETETLADELQNQLGFRLTKAQLGRIRDPDINSRMTVAEFARDVWISVKSEK
jgi:hypothetical protein